MNPSVYDFLITAHYKQVLESGSGIYLWQAGQSAWSTRGPLSSAWDVGVYLLVMCHLESMRHHVFVPITLFSPLGPWLVSVSRLCLQISLRMDVGDQAIMRAPLPYVCSISRWDQTERKEIQCRNGPNVSSGQSWDQISGANLKLVGRGSEGP